MNKNDPNSHTLLFSDFDTSWYKKWAKRLKQSGAGLEKYQLKANKFWQNAVMAEILSKKGLLRNGNVGTGFGVGKERLPALFAEMGIKVLATDQDFRTRKAKLWAKDELANSLDDLNRLGICGQDKFRQNVTLKSVDMKKIPKSLRESSDFIWSNCALGHLGTIEEGLRFIVESAHCLKSSGVAVHTTEINVASNKETSSVGETVVFRPTDLLTLSKLLRKNGFRLEAPRFSFGHTKLDHRISLAPDFGNDYSKILINGHISSQIVLVIDRPKALGWKITDYIKHHAVYLRNLKEQKRFVKENELLRLVSKLSTNYLTEGDLTPVKRAIDVSIKKDRSKYIFLEFNNNSPYPVFPAYSRPHNVQPLMVSTIEPTDRQSIFLANDWVGGLANRPSSYFFTKSGGAWEPVEYVSAGETFALRVKLDTKTVRPGTYTENFGLVHEGVKHFEDLNIKITIKVL